MRAEREAEAAAILAERCMEARAHLRAEMERAGLRQCDGWEIAESVRHAGGKSELIMRPLHMRLPTPPDIECVVSIEKSSAEVDSECEP
ncbi:MAG TPA: hypothetical protein VFE23_07275 [Usitatibacter sp.]|jgi:hypothetical protein|nr:hypothetical protein [Usitatibacter sp.]